MTSRISRRTVLRGAFGATLALPFFESLAQTATLPKRLVVITNWMGSAPIGDPTLDPGYNPTTGLPAHDLFYPTGSETGFTLSTILQPLAAYRSRLVSIRGIENRAALQSFRQGIVQNGGGHTSAELCNLTARMAVPVTAAEKSADPTLPDYLVGESIDQKVARLNGNKPSVLFNSGNGSMYLTGWSFGQNGRPLRYENRDCNVYDRLFVNFTPPTAPTGPTGPDPVLVQRRQALLDRRASVLDAVNAQAGQVNRRLGRTDQQRLDQYLTQLRELELRVRPPEIQSMADAGMSAPVCTKPARPGTCDGSLQDLAQIVAAGFACDQTRVASLSLTRSLVGYTGAYHDDVTHAAHRDPAARELVRQQHVWLMDRVREVVDALTALPEGNGTVADNTLVVVTHELGHSNNHTHYNVPYTMVVGKNITGIRGGRFLSYPRVANNAVWAEVQRAMGINDATFGEVTYPMLSFEQSLPGLA